MRVWIVLGLLVVACGGGSKQGPRPLSASWTAPSMLARVPAESPYLMAMLDPVPESQRRRMFAAADDKLAKARAAFEENRSADRSTLSPQKRALYALFDELEGKSLDHWGSDLGFDPSGRFVLYGLSVWPVLRIAVGNEQRLRQVITHVLSAGGVPTTQRVLRGRSYWQLGDHKLTIIASVADGEAVFAALPTPALPQYLPIVLGLERPPRSLAEQPKLSDLIARYHFLPSMVGYIDARVVADILTQRAATAATELDRPLHAAVGAIEQSCRDDIDRLVAVVPRIVFGYHRLDAKGMHASMVLEMPAALTASLARLRVAVPQLVVGQGPPGILGFGIGARLGEALALLEQVTTHIHDHPFRCPWFAALDTAAAELAATLDRPLPPALLGFRGVSLVVEDAARGEPTAARGHAILVGDHANDLLLVLFKVVPGLASVALVPDGRPVQLPLGQLGLSPTITAYAATRVDRAAIAVGPASATDVVHALEAPLPRRSPLFSFSFDAPRMAELGWLKPEDVSTMRAVTLQLDVGASGLSLDVFDVFGPR